MATSLFKSNAILIEAQKNLECYIKYRDEERKNICKRYINQRNFLRRVLFWLKPLTQKDIEKNLGCLSIGECIAYHMWYDKQISKCKSIIKMCKDSENISLTDEEYNIIKQ